MDRPYVHEGRYGRVTLDEAACGAGFVVEYRPSPWAAREGHQGRWQTFQSYHTALAYFWALTGRREAPPDGRGVKGSRRPALAGRGQPLRPLEAV